MRESFSRNITRHLIERKDATHTTTTWLSRLEFPVFHLAYKVSRQSGSFNPCDLMFTWVCERVTSLDTFQITALRNNCIVTRLSIRPSRFTLIRSFLGLLVKLYYLRYYVLVRTCTHTYTQSYDHSLRETGCTMEKKENRKGRTQDPIYLFYFYYLSFNKMALSLSFSHKEME